MVTDCKGAKSLRARYRAPRSVALTMQAHNNFVADGLFYRDHPFQPRIREKQT